MDTKISVGKISFPNSKIKDFCRQYQVKRMALFGSVLRDDFHSNSDVDVLVVFNPAARVTFLTLGKMKRELSLLFQRPVDLVPQEGLKPAIRDSVLASSKEIYAS